jgi:putative phosphoesterase
MKLFFIGDVHGNEFALKRILEYAKVINSEIIVCSGDISGYFTGTDQVVELLKNYGVRSILGNHDAFLLDIMPIKSSKSYYQAYKKTKIQLSLTAYKWLCSLNCTLDFSEENTSFKVFHGGPEDAYNQYIFPNAIDTGDFENENSDIFVFGHTHLQFGIKLDDKVFINPGSVGLPRNGDFRAHGISFDTDGCIFEEHRIPYDLNGFFNKYSSDTSINKKFFHNINFGRSSNKPLKNRTGLFFEEAEVRLLQFNGFEIINTRFGAVLSNGSMSGIGNLLYVASYDDETIEITSNTLLFDWQLAFFKGENPEFMGVSFMNDNAGIYYRRVLLDEFELRNNLKLIIENSFNITNTTIYKNVKI